MRRLAPANCTRTTPRGGASRILVLRACPWAWVLTVGCETDEGEKLIGYARMSTRRQDADHRVSDLSGASARRDDLSVDHGTSEGRAPPPAFDKAVSALGEGGTPVITTLDRLGRPTQNMPAVAEALRGKGAGLRVLVLGVEPAVPVVRDLGRSRAAPYRRIRELPLPTL